MSSNLTLQSRFWAAPVAFGRTRQAADTAPEKPPSPDELKAFRQRLLACVDRETALNEKASQRAEYARYGSLCKMWGQCVPVAMAVKDRFGGRLIRYELEVRLEGKILRQVHYANEIGGQSFDLTSDQYNGDGLHAVDDPEHGVVGQQKAAPVPVEVLAVRSRKTQSDFYYGRIGHRTLLLAERLKRQIH